MFLMQDKDPVTVAELLRHKDLEMLFKDCGNPVKTEFDTTNANGNVCYRVKQSFTKPGSMVC